MPLGQDKQFDLPWSEQDKIRRRLEIKDRLKQDGVRRRFDPFLAMKGVIYSDPAHDRYCDLRKKGRMPGAPLKPHVFFGMIASIFIPISFISYLVYQERVPWNAKVASGEIPYHERDGKSMI